MAHLHKVNAGMSSQLSRPSERVVVEKQQKADAEKIAIEQQFELSKRAQTPVGNDPLQAFDSSMSREEVRIRFTKLVQRARDHVYA